MRARTIGQRAREGQGYLVWIEAHADQIAAWLTAHEDTGISGVAYDGSRNSPGHSDPTPARALRRSNDATDDWRRRFAAAMVELAELRRQSSGFRVLPPEEVQRSLRAERREPGSGACKVCGRVCQGRVTLADGSRVDDRLKGGRCDTCRKHFDRTGAERPVDCGHVCCEHRSKPGHSHWPEDPAECRGCQMSMEGCWGTLGNADNRYSV